MLKRIPVQQLALGMHIKEFCGSWMEHPFWRSGFLLTHAEELAAIHASSIREVWIDSSLGMDVAAGESVVTAAQADAQAEHDLQELATPGRPPDTVSAAAEFAMAASICKQGRAAVVTMFQEARMGKTVDAESVQQLVDDITLSVSRNPNALISLARLKTADDYTFMHSVAVCAMMIALARQLGLPSEQTRSAGIAGLLHDLGKAVMPMNVLNKPGKLTEAEFNIIKSHPGEGHKLLVAGGVNDAITLEVCLHHHEKMDGSGYPGKFRGDDIGLFAKMGAVCDVYDAITSNRPYKSGWDPAESLRKMAEWGGSHFDPTVFQAFVKSLGIYPIGSLVKLTSGRIGVVTEQGRKSLTMPMVKVFFSTKSNMRILPEVIDLARPGASEKIAGREDPAKWHFADLNELWSGLTGKPW